MAADQHILPPSDTIREAANQVHLRLKVLRLHLGLSEQEMADLCGVTPSSYRYTEAGKRSRGWWPILTALAHKTSVSCDWLLSGENPMRFVRPVAPRNDRRPLNTSGNPMPPRLRVASST